MANRQDTDNKRIAKNTMLLYIRMLVTMIIGLFTSRVVLNTLGIEDFGIYNVVAGVVVLFTFANNAMATGTQRHFSYELGRIDGRLPEIFSACFKIHVVLGLIVVFLGEVIGLWFLNNKLNIPLDRMFAANAVFQIALVNCFVSIIKTPYNASVIAYERMSFYAYISIYDALAKLLLVYALLIIPFDKLIVYSFFLLLVCIIGFLIQYVYVHKHLPGIQFVTINDSKLYRSLLSFSGWTLFGSVTNMLETQGLNMIINIFFGVMTNAAVGISNQVRGVLSQFVNGFQQALNPQLVMSVSSGNRTRQFDLIFRSAKFSFFIMFALSLPIMANLHQILYLWLGQVPNYTVSICILLITVQLVECISSPLYTTIFAIGKIRNYQIIVAGFRLFGIVISFLICNIAIEPYTIYFMPCVVAVLLLLYRVWFINKEISMPIDSFFRKVITPIVIVAFVSIFLVLIYKRYVAFDFSIMQTIIETICIAVLTVIVIFIMGLTSSERIFIFQQIRKVIKI